ncbi:MAG: hypothetical protein WC132_06390, partial [Methanomethylophilus sp.]
MHPQVSFFHIAGIAGIWVRTNLCIGAPRPVIGGKTGRQRVQQAPVVHVHDRHFHLGGPVLLDRGRVSANRGGIAGEESAVVGPVKAGDGTGGVLIGPGAASGPIIAGRPSRFSDCKPYSC